MSAVVHGSAYFVRMGRCRCGGKPEALDLHRWSRRLSGVVSRLSSSLRLTWLFSQTC